MFKYLNYKGFVALLFAAWVGFINPISIQSQNVVSEQARNVAAEFLSQRIFGQKGLGGVLLPEQVHEVYKSEASADKPVYVFQHNEGGFVILSQHKPEKYSIVGYSDSGIFDQTKIPPQLQVLLKYYEDSLTVYDEMEPENVKLSTPIVYALLDTEGVMLDQFSHAEVGGCPTGCVATAVTQLMIYHSLHLDKPIIGSGSYCYMDGLHGEICADFNGIQYTSDELLSFHVGISMEMQYCGSPYGSVPNKDFAPGLMDHFGHFTMNGIKDDYFLKSQLESGRPIYAGIYGDPVGHAIVVDGYDDRGYYHVNFGWAGHYNGYYWLNSDRFISPGGFYRFSTNLATARIVVPYVIPVAEQDSLALIALHNALGGQSATGWDINDPVMTWPGVVIANDRVVQLTLAIEAPPVNSQSIPHEIGNLTALRKLYLHGPFNGNIPASISQLTELRELHIYNVPTYQNETLHLGNLSGALPADLGNLVNLEWLSVSNALEGTIPTTIGNIPNLRILRVHQDTTYFDRGKLTGTIPPEIGNLQHLTQLQISDQKLTGSLPESLMQLSSLVGLDLSGNDLIGEIPVLNYPTLQYLKLANNHFSGIAEGEASCPVLVDLQLQGNDIQGDFPPYFSNFPALRYLNLSGNQIRSLPADIGNLSRLESLLLDNNQLESLPDESVKLYMLKTLSAGGNQISYLPSNLGQGRNLMSVNLSGNQLIEIPEEFGNCPNLTDLNLSGNKILGIPATFDNFRDNVSIYLNDNEMQGAIPAGLIAPGESNSKYVTLGNNRFVYSDLPETGDIGFSIRNQKPTLLQKNVFKVQMGDTVTLDIRSISNLSHPGNEYYWLPYPQLIEVMTYDDRLAGVDNDPVLNLVINEETLGKTYYCKVFNPSGPIFHFDYYGSVVEGACLEYLNTDIVAFQLATDEEILAEEYQNEFVTSLASLPGNAISDGTVTLVAPPKVKRGEVYWEASADGSNWVRVAMDMADTDLKANVKSVSSDELVLAPVTDAWYRCVIAETDCAPMHSQPLKVEAPGVVLYDEIVNVVEEPWVASVDSIEVIVPQHFYDQDFRLTITKLDNLPAVPDSVIAFSAYDVSVDIAGPFSLPLMIRFKNLDKSMVNDLDIDKFRAVWYDDLERQWKHFEHSHLSMKDSTITFLTDHLTKLSIWFDPDAKWGYTDVYERNNIKVFYKDDDVPFMTFGYDKKQSPQPWHIQGYPELVQDVTEFLPQVMSEYQSLGLTVPQGKFSVYIKQMDNAGVVGWQGMTFGYVMIDANILKPEELMSVLAHEYMHFTQDYYISAHVGNSFWMEAHATLSDRIVWDDDKISLAESEETLLRGRIRDNYTFNYLSQSWDASDRGFFTNNLLAQLQHQYLAGTFLHYMRSYRPEEPRLEPATLLKETPWLGGWRLYLSNFVSTHLNSILGDEYEDYVKYIHSGVNEKFTVLNTEGNPFSYLQNPKNKNVYTFPLTYHLKPGDEPVQTDEFNISVPYMASKVVLLENMNPDTMLLVNYTRHHEFSYDDKVYFASWNHMKKEMEFLDISDSTEFNFILDARTRENQEGEFQNYGYILLINKRYIGVSSLISDFDASFELTAMPLLNVENISMLNIYNGPSPITHTFESLTTPGTSDQQYIFIGSPTAAYLESVTHFSCYDFYGPTVKRITRNKTYQVITNYTLVIDQGYVVGAPTMKDSTVYVRTFEHNIMTGDFIITELETKYQIQYDFVDYYEVSPGHFEERLVRPGYMSLKEVKSKIYHLKDIFNYMQPPDVAQGWQMSYGDNLVVFETTTTANTQLVVDEIEAHYEISHYNQDGEVSSVEEWEYTDTNFSQEGLRFLLILKILDESK